MNYATIFIIFTLVFAVKTTDARFYYVGIPNKYDHSPGIHGLYTPDDSNEQTSRDLDMTFLAGDPSEYSDTNNIIYPSSKHYISSALPVVDIIHEDDRRSYIYNDPMGISTSRRIMYGGDSSIYGKGKRDGNLAKFNNERKGVVVLELRVIANNDGL